jgi:hypothetical protein
MKMDVNWWLAWLVAVAHAGLIVLSICGAVAVVCGRFACGWPFPLWQRLYLAAAAGGSLSAVLHDGCVLTTLENCLRERRQSAGAYEGSFVSHYAPYLPDWVADYGSLFLALAAIGAAVRASRQWLAQNGRSKRRIRDLAGADAGRPPTAQIS